MVEPRLKNGVEDVSFRCHTAGKRCEVSEAFSFHCRAPLRKMRLLHGRPFDVMQMNHAYFTALNKHGVRSEPPVLHWGCANSFKRSFCNKRKTKKKSSSTMFPPWFTISDACRSNITSLGLTSVPADLLHWQGALTKVSYL